MTVAKQLEWANAAFERGTFLTSLAVSLSLAFVGSSKNVLFRIFLKEVEKPAGNATTHSMVGPVQKCQPLT